MILGPVWTIAQSVKQHFEDGGWGGMIPHGQRESLEFLRLPSPLHSKGLCRSPLVGLSPQWGRGFWTISALLGVYFTPVELSSWCHAAAKQLDSTKYSSLLLLHRTSVVCILAAIQKISNSWVIEPHHTASSQLPHSTRECAYDPDTITRAMSFLYIFFLLACLLLSYFSVKRNPLWRWILASREVYLWTHCTPCSRQILGMGWDHRT